MSTDYSLLHVYTEKPEEGLSITFGFYEDPPAPTGGGGGIQDVQRPQANPLTAWRGATDGYRLPLNLIMDRYTASTKHGRQPNIELDCRKLEKMYGALSFPAVRPPLLILDANGALQNDVVSRPTLRWVIPEPPTYADVLRNGAGKRVRQVVTINFEVWVAYDELTRSRDNASVVAANTFVASAGISTFKKAASHYLKSYGGARWATRLANLNGFRDPTAALLLGRQYKLPTTAQIKQWEGTTRR